MSEAMPDPYISNPPSYGPDLSIVNNERPEGPFFNLNSIRRSAMETDKLDVKHVVYTIIGSTEEDIYHADPVTYNARFDQRYEKALGERFQFKYSDETRHRVTLDKDGKRIYSEVPQDNLPNIDEYLMDVCDKLEEINAPILDTIKFVNERGILKGTEYIVTMQLCYLIAAQDLPGDSE